MFPFYIIATPIGNIEDISVRSLRILKEDVDIIACEDTRVSKRFLNHYGINKPLISCHANNEDSASDDIIKLLETNCLAYLSDAGTPGISDPGSLLVKKLIAANKQIIPLPGASALTTLVSISGLPLSHFIFYGFLPHKKNRQKKIVELMAQDLPFIIYESPHRILKFLNELQEIDENRQIVIGRELTKPHEQLIRGSAKQIIDLLLKPDIMRGEFTVIISGK